MNLTQTQLRPESFVNTITINPPTSQYTYGGDRIMRCAIYARVSTEFDSQKTSIDNQIDLFRNYAIQQGWEIVKIYCSQPAQVSLFNQWWSFILSEEFTRKSRQLY